MPGNPYKEIELLASSILRFINRFRTGLMSKPLIIPIKKAAQGLQAFILDNLKIKKI